ncbi:MAG: AzlD domain-containing protein [Lachnospiraceae bacterium]
MNRSVWIYIFVMALVSYLLRALPITLIRRQIKNRFIRSVLYYLPYVTLSVMTVPAIFTITQNPLCGAIALAAAAATAWLTSNLLLSATVSCIAVFIVTLL